MVDAIHHDNARQGSIDWLTGLPNMADFLGFAKQASSALEARDERLTILALDLIGLKTYNARYGRSTGDDLLKLFAHLLGDRFGVDACARFGEDHFYAFAAETDVPFMLESLFADLERSQEIKTLPVRVGAYALDKGEDPEAVGLDRARFACDLDRKTWQSHVIWFDDAMRSDAELRIHVLEHVDEAIKEGWIRPHYQAIVRAATGELCGEEALARWDDPEFGMLTPDDFIPVIEEAGLLYKIDMHMVECVLADFVEKQKHGIGLAPVSVNISQRDFTNLDIAEEVRSRADALGISHGLLRVEFTESAASEDPVAFKQQVDALRAEGFEVWMDDFGSGFSSLGTLQKFDFDLVKLDMGLIEDIVDEKALKVVIGIVQMASQLGIGVLAEGVEAAAQAELLEGAGCGMLQGYLYSRPLPLVAVMGRFLDGIGIRREDLMEADYWDAIAKVNLRQLSQGDFNRTFEGTWREYPAGIIEQRADGWRFLRVNDAYRSFLEDVGMLDFESPRLQANPVNGELDEEFMLAVERCSASGDWVAIASHLEYGTGMHYRVKPAASSDAAKAFVVAAGPTTFGVGLGVYGDVPVAYAVFRAVLDETNAKVLDVEYVYANEKYCEWGGYQQENLAGRSFLGLDENTSDVWFPYVHRAVVKGEASHDVIYSPETKHWLDFNVEPSPVEGCCIFAFSIADKAAQAAREGQHLE